MKLPVRPAIAALRPMSRFFIERPRFATVVSLVLAFLGLAALRTLPIAQYPEVMPPSISVDCSYPGANTHELMTTVANVIEDEVNGVEGMLYMDSTMTDDGSYNLTVTFDVGADRDIALVKVRSRVGQAMSRLPKEVRDCGVTVECCSIERIAVLNLISKGGAMQQEDISHYFYETIRPELQRIRGVGSVMTDGDRRAIRVWIDPFRCAAMGIDVSEIQTAILNQNIQASIGSVGHRPTPGSHQVITLLSKGRLSKPDEFGAIVVRRDEQGGVVRLRDVARVELGEQAYNEDGTYNNRPSMAVEVYRLPNSNALEMMEAVRARMAELQRRFPADLEWRVIHDATHFIREAIAETVWTLGLTIALVVFVCWLFLQNWRATLVPVSVIPVSILSTFIVMALLGYSVNELTMFGLILAIGTVVDDAIVVVERVQYLMERGCNAKEAAIQAMQDVTGAVIATTLVLLGIFVPIGFLGGMTSMIYRQFAVTISAAVTFSTVCALTLSPALCAVLMKDVKTGAAKWAPFRAFEAGLDYVCTRYAALAHTLVGRPFAVLAILAGMAMWAVHLARTLPDVYVPAEDLGQIDVNIHLPDGMTRDASELVCRELTDRIRALEGVEAVQACFGYSAGYGMSENLADVFVVLKPWKERRTRETSLPALEEKVRAIADSIPVADIYAYSPSVIPGMSCGGSVRPAILSNDDMDNHRLVATMTRMKALMEASPALSVVYTGNYAAMPYVYFDVDRAKCETYRVPLANLYASLQSYVGSLYLNDVNLGNLVNRVIVQADAKGRNDVEAVKRLHVRSETGDMVPVGALVSCRQTADSRVAWRHDRYLIGGFTCMPAPGYSVGEATREVKRIFDENLPKDYTLTWLNPTWFEVREDGMVTPIFILAVIFGYLFLVAQYESWAIPIPVMLSVAVAVLGAFVGLWLADLPVSAFSRLGIILLVALAAKNAILIVEFSKEAHDFDGLSAAGSATVGVVERFRAVMMTAFTFVLGVLPMVWATGAGANARRSIGVTTLAGMLASTLVGVLLVPGLYVIFQRIGDRFERRSV